MAKKDVAVKKDNVVAINEELEAAMAAASAEGHSDFTKDDMAIPFLRILQKMSPQLSRKEGEYIEGAQEGMIMNTVTGEIWEQETGLIVIPCKYIFKHILWKPRDSGGGFVQAFDKGASLPQTEKDERGRDITGDGNILTPTAEYYVLVVSEDDGGIEPALISMSSSQLKVSRAWNAFIDQQVFGPNKIQALPYFNYYKLTTKDESNDQGSWCGWKWELHGAVADMNHFSAGKSFRATVEEGVVPTKYVEDDPTADVM